jgi:hypothetical protein
LSHRSGACFPSRFYPPNFVSGTVCVGREGAEDRRKTKKAITAPAMMAFGRFSYFFFFLFLAFFFAAFFGAAFFAAFAFFFFFAILKISLKKQHPCEQALLRQPCSFQAAIYLPTNPFCNKNILKIKIFLCLRRGNNISPG